MKIYNIYGYLIILAYALACMYFAPARLGPWLGLAIGAIYFIGCWFMAGLYLADVLHMGIAHRALDYRVWFIKAVTIVNNVFGIYVDPIAWVNRHRLHHKNSDHDGDPNKLSSDGLWRTMYRCMMPYECNENLATDPILRLADVSRHRQPYLRDRRAGIEFLFAVEACRRSALRARDVGWDANFRAVGEHDSKLLDPHANLRLPALRG